MRDNMGIAYKFRGEYGWRMIEEAEIWDNGKIVDQDTGRKKLRKRRRRGKVDRRNRDGEER